MDFKILSGIHSKSFHDALRCADLLVGSADVSRVTSVHHSVINNKSTDLPHLFSFFFFFSPIRITEHPRLFFIPRATWPATGILIVPAHPINYETWEKKKHIKFEFDAISEASHWLLCHPSVAKFQCAISRRLLLDLAYHPTLSSNNVQTQSIDNIMWRVLYYYFFQHL